MKEILLIGAGGFVGANARYLVGKIGDRYLGDALPWGTLLANVTGSFLLGVFMAWAASRLVSDPGYRAFLAVGFCGAYTTFSTYAFQTVELIERGQYASAALNVVTNNLLTLAAALAGIVLVRWAAS